MHQGAPGCNLKKTGFYTILYQILLFLKVLYNFEVGGASGCIRVLRGASGCFGVHQGASGCLRVHQGAV